MTETGWPLIPREVLPAPVPAAKRHPPPRPHHPDPGHQLPFFGAETTEPSPADLAGLLAGPGRLGRMGSTARVTVEVDAAWRVHVLVAELVVRGLTAHWRPLQERDEGPRDLATAPFDDVYPDPDAWSDSSATDDPPVDDPRQDDQEDPPHPDAGRHLPVPGELSLTAGRRPAPPGKERGTSEPPDRTTDEEALDTQPETDETLEPAKPRFEVLTAYSSRLNGLARAWPDAAAQLFLGGQRLRLWVAAAGEPVPGGYALGLDPEKDLVTIDAALVRAGLAGRLSGDGQHYLIMGKRRLRRLAELVGERPAAAPEVLWPGGAGA